MEGVAHCVLRLALFHTKVSFLRHQELEIWETDNIRFSNSTKHMKTPNEKGAGP